MMTEINLYTKDQMIEPKNLKNLQLRQFQHETGDRPEGFIQAPSEPLLMDITPQGIRIEYLPILGNGMQTVALPRLSEANKVDATLVGIAQLGRHAKYNTAVDPVLITYDPKVLKTVPVAETLESSRQIILRTQDARTAAALFILQLHLKQRTNPEVFPWNPKEVTQNTGEPFAPTTGNWFTFFERNGLECIDNSPESLMLILLNEQNGYKVFCNYELLPAFPNTRTYILTGGEMNTGDLKFKRATMEALEETGAQLNPSTYKDLGIIYAWPERQTTETHIGICEGSRGTVNGRGDETTTIYKGIVPLDKFLRMIKNRTVKDARLVATFAKAYNLGLLDQYLPKK